jgi:hypothetical protein
MTKKHSKNENLLISKEAEEYKKAEIEKRKKEFEELSGAVDRIFKTADGKLFADWLIKECGAFQNSVVVTNGEISNRLTIYNEGRRDLYLQLRKMLTTETLIEIEIK